MLTKHTTQNEVITLRVSTKLRRQIETEAKALGLSVSDFLRLVLTNHLLANQKPGEKQSR